MTFFAWTVYAIASIEAAVFAFVPFAQSGALGENADGSYLDPLTTVTYWLTAIACLAAAANLCNCFINVTKYPSSSRRSLVRTGSLVGFATINVAYFVFAVWVGIADDNPAMFGYSLLGLGAAALAGILLQLRPRILVRQAMV